MSRNPAGPFAPSTDFVPDGYLSTRHAIDRVAATNHPKDWIGCAVYLATNRNLDDAVHKARTNKVQFRLLQKSTAVGKRMGGLPRLTHAESELIEDELRQQFASEYRARGIAQETTDWLRRKLYSGELEAQLLSSSGNMYPVPSAIWASDEAPTILLSGIAEFFPGAYGYNWSPLAPPLKGRVLMVELKLTELLRRIELAHVLAGSATPIADTSKTATPSEAIKPKERGRGRPKGAGSLEAADVPLLEEMKALRDGDSTLSVNAAALKVADRAAGGGTLESKARRLAERYAEKIDDQTP